MSAANEYCKPSTASVVGYHVGNMHMAILCFRPCILIFDSLAGPGHGPVIRALREYLDVEWKVRKGTERSFDKDIVRGCNVKCPQQNNYSDCGIYVLQYVESFFQVIIPLLFRVFLRPLFHCFFFSK